MKDEKSNNLTTEKNTCFIITPIGEPTGEIRRRADGLIDSIIKPILDDPSINMRLAVAHRNYASGDISSGIIKDIFNAKLVIADLTTLNPNVMYEVAIRDCLKKPIILISEEGTVLPFDIKMMNTIMYRNDFKGVVELKEKLKAFIENIDFDNFEADNLVTKANLTLDLYKEVERLPETNLKEVLNSIAEKLEKIENQSNHSNSNKLLDLAYNNYLLDNKKVEFDKGLLDKAIKDLNKPISFSATYPLYGGPEIGEK